MAQNFLTCDREQSFLLPPDLRDWLPEDHLAWFVVGAVGVMDLSGFYAAYREDGLGRAAYEPSMMVALILYCWSRGMRSARRIERACLEDVACRVIAANQRPDHATIARFIERHQGALGDLFGEVLVLCADAGLATVGVVAIDGTKVAANANRDQTMSYEQVAQAIVEEAIATDAAEDAEFGGRRGDELPEAVATRQGRERWLRDARKRLDRERAERGEVIPRSRGKRLVKAKARLEEELAVDLEANRAYEAYRARGVDKTGRRFGKPPKPYTPSELPGGKVNLSDPDSKLVHGMRGWVQGYNAQAVCNEQHLILAAEVMTASPDFGHLEPMLSAAQAELAGAGVNQNPEVVVADAGYWHLEQMNKITGKGVPVLIPPDSTHRRDPRPGWTGGAYAFMRSVLAGERGKALYKQRAQLVEPVFGDAKHNRGFTRFARRGRAAARTEWRLLAATHNLLKLHQHFAATA
ncbi:MAG TPA: transposase [Solirubrobacteraceae bacterium]|nr:transposase [Solirubrobacteraceae bacterium]